MNKNKLLKINNITFSSNKSFISLFNYLSNNINNLNNIDLINIYKELFKIIFILIQNNLISNDLYNLNNYLFDNKNNFIYLSNNFNFININSKLSPKEIFIYYLYYIIRFDLNNHLYKFIINKEIFYKSLNKFLNKNILEKIYKDLFINYSLTKTKFNLIYYLNKDYIINILYLSIYNFNKLNKIKNNIKDILIKNNDELNDNIINKYNFNKLEKNYINLKLNYKNIKNILDDLIFVLQKENNDDIILYYNKSNPLIGFVKKDLNNSNINNYIKIKTNKYLKLNNKFNLNDLNDLNKNNLNKKIKEKYFILDYNIESYILNWCGYINKYHYLSYAGLRLYSLNRKLFNEIVNDYKTLDNHNFTKKYKSDKYINDVLLQRSIGSIINCLNRNINFKNEFNKLTNYINQNKKKYKILFRGERKYETTNFNNIIEYKNIHTFTDNKDEAIKFMSNYYFNYDNNIKEYNLFILINGLTAKIKPLLINDKEEISNWTEYLHTKTKYKIIKIKKDKININYKNNETKTLNYNIIYLNEY